MRQKGGERQGEAEKKREVKGDRKAGGGGGGNWEKERQREREKSRGRETKLMVTDWTL